MPLQESTDSRNADVIIAKLEKNSRETVYVTKGSYNGHAFIGMRVWVPGREGELIPTQKGINLAPDKIAKLIEALQQATAE